jgi:hypothetical protein
MSWLLVAVAVAVATLLLLMVAVVARVAHWCKQSRCVQGCRIPQRLAAEVHTK